MVIEFKDIEPSPPPTPKCPIVVGVMMGLALVALAACVLNMDKPLLMSADSHSMFPTILADETVMVKRVGPDDPIPLGAVVAMRFPGQDLLTLKRVIAREGQVVRLSDAILSVDNHVWTPPLPRDDERATRETYWQPLKHPPQEVEVPQGRYFVLGDNWGMGLSSFSTGPISRDLIVGVVTRVVWPIQRYRAVE